MPVRIAQVIGRLESGGVEAIVMNYYRKIDHSKIQYDFFIIEDEKTNQETKNEIISLGGNFFPIPPYEKQPAYQRELFRLFRDKKYPIVHAQINTLSVFPLFAAWRAGIKIRISHNHNTAGKGEFKRNLMKYTLRPFAKLFPTHLCACSRYAGEWLFGKRAVDSGRVKIWPNAIDTSRFAFNETLRNETRKELNLGNKFVVGHVGRFMKQKNHEFLLEIFIEIHKRRNDSILLLAGDGPLIQEIKDKVAGLGLNDCVMFLGNVTQIEKCYNAMDVFILPSLYEGLGMVAVEAQVSNLPVICSDQVPNEAAICDEIRFISLDKSASEWADEALKLSDQNTRRDMTSAAREHGFDIEEEALKLQEWYFSLLGIKNEP